MGPPKLAQKSLRLNGACGAVAGKLKKFRASRALFLKNSNSSPWYSLVPERVAKFTMAPAFRPYSAGKDELSILYSASVSIGGWKVIWFLTLWFMLMPLTNQFAVFSPWPTGFIPNDALPPSVSG